MANPSKAKGTAAETACVRWLRLNGYPGADRQPLRGNRDAGDLALAPGLVVEVKNRRGGATGQPAAGDLDDWMRQAETERLIAGADHCPLIVKRSGTADVGRWFAYVPAWSFAALVGAPDRPAHPEARLCTDVASLVVLMRHAGYGTAPEQVAS